MKSRVWAGRGRKGVRRVIAVEIFIVVVVVRAVGMVGEGWMVGVWCG